ncbi:MAG: SUMF1/EgtB/PvdO family nonheme iron enzyme [Spirochaetota bacterium]
MLLRSLPRRAAFTFLFGLALILLQCSSTEKRNLPTPDATGGSQFTFTRNDRLDCSMAGADSLCLETGRLAATAASLVPGSSVTPNTVFIDRSFVTNGEYSRCVADGQCVANSYLKGKKAAVSAATAPAIGLPFESAMMYCAWAGKRLPTETELYLASTQPGFTAAAQSEWTNDWHVSDESQCTVTDGKAKKNICAPANPMGICGGAFGCSKWLRDKKTFNAAGRTSAVQPITSKTDTAFRCVAENVPPTAAPAWMIQKAPAPLGDPAAPSEAQLKILHEIGETDVLNKPICKAKYTSPAHCKDPVTYFTPNESQNYLFAPYIRNLGGGYAGVAADANYSYIALARSRFVWLFDFDVNINALHRIIRAMVLESETVAQFLDRFSKKQQKASLEILARYYADRNDLDFIQQVFRNNYEALGKHYRRSAAPDKKQGDFGWLRHAEHYRYIRLLYQQNRIAIVPADMLKEKSIRAIGRSARALGVPIRVYYPSNAEEFWDYSTNDSNYKKNVLSLPFDEASITFRSVHEYPWHPAHRKGFKGFWHYVVHGAYNYQKRLLLPHYDYMDYFKMHRVVSKDRADFSTIEIPAAIPAGILEQGY